MRSDSVAHSGMRDQRDHVGQRSTTHSRVVRSRPTASLVPVASDQVPKIVLTTETSAHSTTRSTSAQWSRSRTGDRQLGDLVGLLDLLERRGLGQRAADPVADGDDDGATARTGSASPR